jgi:hypothetical protein
MDIAERAKSYLAYPISSGDSAVAGAQGFTFEYFLNKFKDFKANLGQGREDQALKGLDQGWEDVESWFFRRLTEDSIGDFEKLSVAP